jgi:hypothetical protein
MRWAILTQHSDFYEKSWTKCETCGTTIRTDYLPPDEAQRKRDRIDEFHAIPSHSASADSLLEKAAMTGEQRYLEAFAQTLEVYAGHSPNDAYLTALEFTNERRRWDEVR